MSRARGVRALVAFVGALLLFMTPGTTSAAWTDDAWFSASLTTSWRMVEIKWWNTQKCLDIVNGAPTSGLQLQIYDCNHIAAAQRFLLAGDGTIRTGTGWSLCVAIDPPATDRSPVVLRPCGTAPAGLLTWNQDTASVSPYVRFVTRGPWSGGFTSGCMDNADILAVNGNKIIAWPCNGSPSAQSWNLVTW